MDRTYLGLRVPDTFAMYDAGTKCDERLVKAVIKLRVEARAVHRPDFQRNASAWFIEVDGKEMIQPEFNVPKAGKDGVGIHSESVVAKLLEKFSKKKILQVLSERIPCEGCEGILVHHLRVPKSNVFYIVSERKERPDSLMRAYGVFERSAKRGT